MTSLTIESQSAHVAGETAWLLRMLRGPQAGKVWPLTDRVMTIGRGIGCQVRVEDPHVSRNQCELARDGERLRIRNLSERTLTVVNGKAIIDAPVTAGDIIGFAMVEFGVECRAAAAETGSSAGDFRTTQRFGDAVHLRQDYDGSAYRNHPQLTADLHGLFTLLRQLGRAESLDAMVENLKRHLRERLRTPAVWIAWRLRSVEDLTLYPAVPPEETAGAPFAIIRDACENGLGVKRDGAADPGSGPAVAAPLMHAGEAIGAVAACRAREDGDFGAGDLQYLMAVAECTAPLIRAAERLEQLQRDAAANAGLQGASNGMLGNSEAMQALRVELHRAASARTHVILLGETGVGKELAARMVHDLSPRASGPYVIVNCAAIPSELFESEVFGHERGAFTGASRGRKGFFEEAHGGTLFLDEVGDLSTANQARLLRAVETGTFRPVGGDRDVHVDVRVVCATNRRLPDQAQTFFRQDLFHRLAGVVVRIVPLRERPEDIVLLSHHFLTLAAPHSTARPLGFTGAALERLARYHWPGNVRELRNVVEWACYTAKNPHIAEGDIYLGDAHRDSASQELPQSLDEIERTHLVATMRRAGNNVGEAARLLGMPRSTLYYKLAHHGIKARNGR